MSHYVIQALLDGNIVYHRETPVRAGVENLINEGISQLFSVSGGNPGRDAVVEVLRYYDEDPVPEVELVVFADSHEELFFEAEALTEAKGKVRTMSGKPHTPRKLKQDSGISPEEAARRIALKSESKIFYADTMEWDIDYLESYETPYGTKLDGVLYNPTTGESAEFEGITIETSIPDIDPMYANMEDIPTYESENEDNLGPMFMAEEKKNCGCGQDPCVTYGAETFEAPKSKRKGFLWEYYDYGDTPRIKAANESYDKNAGAVTIGPAAKKAQKDGWKLVNDPSTPRIWGMMAKSPQWKPWVKDLTARCKYERHIMSETTDIFNGTAYWKKPGDYSPDHMGEDGDWEILTKDNKILLLYFYADDELSTRLMRKTFTVPKTKAKPKATTRKSKPKAAKKLTAKTGRKAPTISATKRKVGTRMRGNDGKMWQVKKSGKSQRWMAGAETFEAPKTKKGFNWFDWEEKTAEHPRETLTKSVKKAKQDGWKQVSWMQSGGKREKQIWGKMAQSPQWNAWVKDFTARCKYEQIMSETYMVFNGTAYWKDTYDPDHMGEEGEWTILTKDNKVLLFYYYSDWENTTTVMRKTFTIPVKPVAKAKAKKTTTRKSPAKKGKAKTTKKTVGRKAPTISATKRKVGTRMRGNDGKMWEVKKSGKSQRWMAGAETQTQTFHSSIDSKFDELL